MNGPVGPNVSADLARHQERSASGPFCHSRALTSIAAGIAEDVVEGLFGRDAGALLADDDDELRLFVHAAGVPGKNDVVTGANEAVGGLVEGLGPLGLGCVVEVAAVVEGHGQGLCGLAGGQELDVFQGVGVVGNLVLLEGCGGDLLHEAVFHDTVGHLSVGEVAGKLHAVSFCLRLSLSGSGGRVLRSRGLGEHGSRRA